MPLYYNAADVQVMEPPSSWTIQPHRVDHYGDRLLEMRVDMSDFEDDATGWLDADLLMQAYIRLADWAQGLNFCINRVFYGEWEVQHNDYEAERSIVYRVIVDTEQTWERSCYAARSRVFVGRNSHWIGDICEDCNAAAEISSARCMSCQEQYASCGGCGDEVFTDDAYYDENHGEYYCSYCWDEHRADGEYVSEDEMEQQDIAVESVATTLLELDADMLRFNPERGDQLTSVELEFGRDPEGVALELYRAGLSPARTVGGYHEQARRNRGSAYVEYDGSVGGGGEMVISMVRLPDEQETQRLWNTVKVLQDKVHAGENNLNMHCGCHIHVNALGRDLNSIISTVVAYNHIEDILYRISAANYKHHRLDNGNDYATPTEKSITDKDRFRASFGTRRYYGLNVGNYLAYRHECNCGAGFDHASQCVCDASTFYKPTLEFRLFNTTANRRKLHAFVAICQALVTYGTNRELLSRDLTPMEYNRHRNTYEASMYVNRLLWMLTELPFSAEERNSIRYCIRNSSLKDVLERGVANGEVEASDVQAILHEDELLEISEYVIPQRAEESVTGSTATRQGWVQTNEYDRSGVRLFLDPMGRYRHGITGRYATPVRHLPDPERQPDAYAATQAFWQAVEADNRDSEDIAF